LEIERINTSRECGIPEDSGREDISSRENLRGNAIGWLKARLAAMHMRIWSGARGGLNELANSSCVYYEWSTPGDWLLMTTAVSRLNLVTLNLDAP
jgi:hypothetical protein